MGKFLVAYELPVRHRKRVVDAPSPEIAAKHVRDQIPGMTHIMVEDLENSDDSDAEKEVYEWCEGCGLPIWIDDDSASYVMTVHGDVSDKDDSFMHVACMRKKP